MTVTASRLQALCTGNPGAEETDSKPLLLSGRARGACPRPGLGYRVTALTLRRQSREAHAVSKGQPALTSTLKREHTARISAQTCISSGWCVLDRLLTLLCHVLSVQTLNALLVLFY